MTNRLTITFLLLFVVFALVHLFAVTVSLYWYYSWFDIVMHLWGGMLIGLGIHTMYMYHRFPIKPPRLLFLSGSSVLPLAGKSLSGQSGFTVKMPTL